MGRSREFEIAFVGLKPGVHEFHYELGEEFFTEEDVQDIKHPKTRIRLLLEKNSGFMMLTFEVGGSVEVTCDRCGNPLSLELWDEFKMLVKLVDHPEEMNEQEEDPDVFYISRTESHLDVRNWLYEFTLLSIPLQNMCSPDKIGGPQCNLEVLEKLRQMEQGASDSNANNLWKGLDKFRDNQ